MLYGFFIRRPRAAWRPGRQRVAHRAVLACLTGRFARPNGLCRSPGRPVLQPAVCPQAALARLCQHFIPLCRQRAAGASQAQPGPFSRAPRTVPGECQACRCIQSECKIIQFRPKRKMCQLLFYVRLHDVAARGAFHIPIILYPGPGVGRMAAVRQEAAGALRQAGPRCACGRVPCQADASGSVTYCQSPDFGTVLATTRVTAEAIARPAARYRNNNLKIIEL